MIVDDPRSRGDGTVGEAAHPRLIYRPELDGIRGVAIALVIVGHLAPDAPGAWVGVQLFFVLSGYLITSLLIDEHARTGRIALAAFWIRRARRLLPALVALLVAMAFVVPLGTLALAGSYVANWAGVAGANLGPLGHTWSLAIEEQFYVLWPLVAIPLLRHRRALVVAVAVIFAARFVVPFEWAYFATPLRADALLVGALLAVTGVRRRWELGALGLFVALVAIPYYGPLLPLGLAMTTLSAGAIVSAPPAWLAVRPLVSLGRISYALYLWHWPLLLLLGPIGLPVAVVVAAASTRFVERPFRLVVVRGDAGAAGEVVGDRGMEAPPRVVVNATAGHVG